MHGMQGVKICRYSP